MKRGLLHAWRSKFEPLRQAVGLFPIDRLLNSEIVDPFTRAQLRD
jgi:hypothetical protein